MTNIISKTKTVVIKEEYQIEMPDGKIVYYTDFMNEDGKVIDCTLRDKHGDIDDPAILEEIQSLIDEQQHHGY
jgi:hypothetical protein